MKERDLEKLAVQKFDPNEWILWFPKKEEFLRTDIFNVFDFLALNRWSGQIRFYQITTIQHRAERYNKIMEWIVSNMVKKGYFYLWCYDPKRETWREEALS